MGSDRFQRDGENLADGNFEEISDSLTTVEACRLAGRQFGGGQISVSLVGFEKALEARLVSLSGSASMEGEDLDEAIAAFDQAAWIAWEAGLKGGEKTNSDDISSLPALSSGN